MAYIEFEVSSISSQVTTGVYNTNAPQIVYGTMFGTAGYWLKLPGSAPPIGEVSVAAGVYGWGLWYEIVGSTSNLNAGYSRMGPVTILGFQRGDRWIRFTKIVLVGVQGGASSKRKRFKLWYRSTNEQCSPTT
jgi:hypothetical protein